MKVKSFTFIGLEPKWSEWNEAMEEPYNESKEFYFHRFDVIPQERGQTEMVGVKRSCIGNEVWNKLTEV